MKKGGNGRSCNLFGKTEIDYPVSFDLKVIMNMTRPVSEQTKYLEDVFSSLHIPNSSWRNKSSKQGNYMSHTIHVTIMNQSILEELYSKLKSNPEIKFAL
jgi:putative lipoic acid-binding regulatory protein